MTQQQLNRPQEAIFVHELELEHDLESLEHGIFDSKSSTFSHAENRNTLKSILIRESMACQSWETASGTFFDDQLKNWDDKISDLDEINDYGEHERTDHEHLQPSQFHFEATRVEKTSSL